MRGHRKLATPEEWVLAFQETEAGWMESDERWWTPPRLISETFLGFDAGCTAVETQAGLVAMLCANHAIQHRRTVELINLGDSNWESLDHLYLEVMMVYNMPFFKDHLTCGTSMRYPFPDFTKTKSMQFDFMDADAEQYSVAITTNEEYEVLLNGIALYFDRWITAVGRKAFTKMIERLERRESLSGLLLKGYREEERKAAVIEAGLAMMDDDGDCI